MSGFHFNKRDFDKLTAIASSLVIIARNNKYVRFSIEIGENSECQMISLDDADNFINSIFDKEPDSSWYEDDDCDDE